jgi:hypothetical protein
MDAAEKLYELAKALPKERVGELLDFAEYLLHRGSRQEAVPENQPLDFRQAAGLGQEIWKGIDAQHYIQQERAEWD